ncbi:NAD(P)H-binding protein [Kitasatospora sp. NPDC057500]|uniref:NAD(P)H-binding protein n=1 Tax=Kitasatospora sp. NPDC057500 TaxID=3346151 RepID=UPI0036C512A3
MLAVTGTTGRFGLLALTAVLALTEGRADVVALTRDPARAGADPDRPDVPVRQADFARPDTLPSALAGVRRLLLVSTERSPRRLRLHEAAVEAAVAAGVEHVVYTSVVRAADPGNPVPEAADHRRTELLLAGSGLPHTVLRFNVWPQMLLLTGLARLAVAHGELPSSAADGRVGYITREDTAWAAARVLTEAAPAGAGSVAARGGTALDGTGAGGTGAGGTGAGGADGTRTVLDVTGPGLTDADVAAALAEATGRPVRHRPVADADVHGALTALGVPAPLAAGWGENDAFRRRGWFDVPDDGTTRRLLGRAPVTLTGFFAAHRAELLAQSP